MCPFSLPDLSSAAFSRAERETAAATAAPDPARVHIAERREILAVMGGLYGVESSCKTHPFLRAGCECPKEDRKPQSCGLCQGTISWGPPDNASIQFPCPGGVCQHLCRVVEESARHTRELRGRQLRNHKRLWRRNDENAATLQVAAECRSRPPHSQTTLCRNSSSSRSIVSWLDPYRA